MLNYIIFSYKSGSINRAIVFYFLLRLFGALSIPWALRPKRWTLRGSSVIRVQIMLKVHYAWLLQELVLFLHLPW